MAISSRAERSAECQPEGTPEPTPEPRLFLVPLPCPTIFPPPPPQDQALEIVRSVGLAFEMSQCPEPETGADTGPEEELDGPASPEQLSRPAPGLSRPAPDQLSAESASSASGDDTPRQTDGECLQTEQQRHTLRQTCSVGSRADRSGKVQDHP